MTMNTTQETNQNRTYQDFLKSPAFEKETGQEPWLTKIREKSYERFRTLGFPTRKNEAWKYIDPEPILNSSFFPLDGSGPGDFQNETLLKKYFLSPDESNRLVFLNGIYSEKFSIVEDLSPGCVFENLSSSLEKRPDLIKPYLAKNAPTEPDSFVLANTFSFKNGLFLFLAAGCEIKNPIHFLFLETGETRPSVFHPRILIVADEKSKANIVFNHIGSGDQRYFMNAVMEIHLRAHAHLHGSVIQRNAYQFLAIRAELEQGSKLNIASFQEGGTLVRNETHVNFKGKNASCSLAGLSLLSGDCQGNHLVTVRHEVSECRSRQLYKNILGEHAKSEFTSLVHVYPDAQKSDSNQLNRNLLLSDSARVFSRPQLKIDADDVKATHGAATGPLENEELFYLRSRGLNAETARFLLIDGFAEEVLKQIEPSFLRQELEKSVRQQIEKIAKEMKP